MKHDWEPVDNQGYTMECERCGTHIYIESSEWDKEIDAECPGVDITVIQSPFKSGACEVCTHHYIGSHGMDICSKNHIGILTRICSKIPECRLFVRNFFAGAAGTKG